MESSEQSGTSISETICPTMLQSGTKVADTLVWNGCFYQTFNSLIISFLLSAVNSITPPPESMLSEVKERLGDPKYNIDFGGKGLG